MRDAEPWLAFSDDELWEMMFGHTITRSWMVWSSGHCPGCKGQTPMYTWRIEALAHPWKTGCPHCGELFPKNDFHAFYRSGLDGQAVFDPTRADRSLLYNTEHPDPKDPLHSFGVDDGEGYVEGERRWRFIGAYLVYGQWKQLVLGGIRRLSAAYVVTGDPSYAHRTGVLLDRVADLYPTFDFEREGLAYERPHSSGYVSTWHDACEETRELAEAYDRVFDCIADDRELVDFLTGRAARHRLQNPKRSFADVQRNIEAGILHDALRNAHKIHSNYPHQENTLLIIETILGWPVNRERVRELLDDILAGATAVDGMTGEKGLAGYATIGPRSVSRILGLFSQLESGLLEEVNEKHPRLRELIRFHIDTWCLGRYYPHVGDSGTFTSPFERYGGVRLDHDRDLEPSGSSFMIRMAELTQDPVFAQVVYQANGGSTDGLPYDLFAADCDASRRYVQEVIDREGTAFHSGSVNKQAWHICILRSGKAEHARALWLDYESGGRHGHLGGMNLGLFARGMDLLPELGYPPVQFGGWGSPRANWYKMTAGHNTVVVDGRDQEQAAGRTTLWADGECFHAIRVSAPELYGIERYERTAVLVDLGGGDAYVMDVFRVCGGTDHAKFLHSGFGRLRVAGLDMAPGTDYGHGTQMRCFRGSPRAEPGWSAEWRLEDRHGVLQGEEAYLRSVDLTEGAGAWICEAWVSLGYDEHNEEEWIPRVLVRRTGSAPLESTFVSVLEAHGGRPRIAGVRRLLLEGPDGEACDDSHVAVEIALADGNRDLIVAVCPEKGPRAAVQREWELRLDGELCWVRRDPQGRIGRMAIGKGRRVRAGQVEMAVPGQTEFLEAET